MLISPAKLNLGLRIVGRRPDGFHLLQSLFWPINFYDEIHIESAASSSVTLEWADDAPISQKTLLQNHENLIGKVVLGTFGWRPKTTRKISVKKRIPIGGGLGGISSNVGTVLKYFIESGEISRAEAEALALKAGADVPFFLNPEVSWVTGIGETSVPVKVSQTVSHRACFLLICFPEGTSTPLLFEAFRKSQWGFSHSWAFPVGSEVSWDFFKDYCRSTANDLQTLAAQHYPLVGTALHLLKTTDCIYSGLSGSGSTCFAIYENAEKREKGAKVIDGFCRDHQCRSVLSESL